MSALKLRRVESRFVRFAGLASDARALLRESEEAEHLDTGAAVEILERLAAPEVRP